MSSVILPTNDGMLSYYNSFISDDTLVEIVPSFDLQSSSLLSGLSSLSLSLSLVSSAVGELSFVAGIPTYVPLWLGSFIHHRSLGHICVPYWLTISNIKRIIQYEHTNATLYYNIKYLPLNYYEITHRYMKLLSSSSNSSSNSTTTHTHNNIQENDTTNDSDDDEDNNNNNEMFAGNNSNIDAIQLLIQDLFDIRIDKLRKQFQSLAATTTNTNIMSNGTTNDDISSTSKSTSSSSTTTNDNHNNIMLVIPGIGTQERAILGKFLTHALTDFHTLSTNSNNNINNNADDGKPRNRNRNRNLSQQQEDLSNTRTNDSYNSSTTKGSTNNLIQIDKENNNLTNVRMDTEDDPNNHNNDNDDDNTHNNNNNNNVNNINDNYSGAVDENDIDNDITRGRNTNNNYNNEQQGNSTTSSSPVVVVKKSSIRRFR